MTEDVTVLLPVYHKDDPRHFEQAIDSIFQQSLLPDSLLIIKDGPVTSEINSVLDKAVNRGSMLVEVERLETNNGLSSALRYGVKRCNTELIARMDADDISVNDRIEKQLKTFKNQPEIGIVGGNIAEFDKNPNNIISRRKVPMKHDDIEKMARFRSPMNHGTVMFRKSSVIESGNYRKVDRMEDYDLWVRMLLNDVKFKNLADILVKVRAGEDMYARRGGLEYAREEVRTQVESYERNFIPFHIFIINLALRTPLRLVPNKIRKLVYRYITRDNQEQSE